MSRTRPGRAAGGAGTVWSCIKHGCRRLLQSFNVETRPSGSRARPPCGNRRACSPAPCQRRRWPMMRGKAGGRAAWGLLAAVRRPQGIPTPPSDASSAIRRGAARGRAGHLGAGRSPAYMNAHDQRPRSIALFDALVPAPGSGRGAFAQPDFSSPMSAEGLSTGPTNVRAAFRGARPRAANAAGLARAAGREKRDRDLWSGPSELSEGWPAGRGTPGWRSADRRRRNCCRSPRRAANLVMLNLAAALVNRPVPAAAAQVNRALKPDGCSCGDCLGGETWPSCARRWSRGAGSDSAGSAPRVRRSPTCSDLVSLSASAPGSPCRWVDSEIVTVTFTTPGLPADRRPAGGMPDRDHREARPRSRRDAFCRRSPPLPRAHARAGRSIPATFQVMWPTRLGAGNESQQKPLRPPPAATRLADPRHDRREPPALKAAPPAGVGGTRRHVAPPEADLSAWKAVQETPGSLGETASRPRTLPDQTGGATPGTDRPTESPAASPQAAVGKGHGVVARRAGAAQAKLCPQRPGASPCLLAAQQSGIHRWKSS